MSHYRVRGLDGREFGPVALDVLIQWAQEGRIAANMAVERDHSGLWVPAATLQELSGVFGSPPGANTPISGPSTGYGPETLFAIHQESIGPPVRSPNPDLSIGRCFGTAMRLLDMTMILQIVVGFLLICACPIPFLISAPVTLGIYRCALDRVDGKRVEFGRFFNGFDSFKDALLGELLYVVALFTYCFPPLGVFIHIKFYLWYLHLADRPRRGGFECLQDSFESSNGHFLQLLLLGITGVGVLIVGILFCFVGVFVSMAVVSLAAAVAYRELVPAESGVAERAVPA
ncbi:MAG: hypothetical protein HY286_11620 [Planctomycetes bacterium]|nr:hypothetical protein [Planctomycetota bacterium]